MACGPTGPTLVARSILLINGEPAAPDFDKISDQYFGGNTLVGSMVAGETRRSYTDLRIHPDGFGRVLIEDFALTPRQAERTIQRMVEINTVPDAGAIGATARAGIGAFLADASKNWFG